MRLLISLLALAAFSTAPLLAQERMPSPRGEASTQIDESWIVVDYGRPILRSRTDIFEMGDSYGAFVTGDTPVWRAGANKSTQFMTERDLMIGDHHVGAGEYLLFVDLDEGNWSFILSSHISRPDFDSEEPGIWGSSGYSNEKDVVRTKMDVEELPWSVDQFTISFIDVTEDGGVLALMWDDTMATVDFTLMK